MKTEKEIGKALEKKLQGAHKSPPPAMWEKINDSLDARDRRRKKALWLWGAGILLIGLLGVYVATNYNENNNKVVTTKEINTSEGDSATTISASEIDNNAISTSNNTFNTKNPEGEISEKIGKSEDGKSEGEIDNGIKISEKTSIEIEGQIVTDKDNEIEISEEKAKQSTQKLKKPTERIIDEGYEVTKSYRYYNSKTKEEIFTENKKMMDSVVEKNIQLQKSLDSITELKSKMEKKKDSI